MKGYNPNAQQSAQATTLKGIMKKLIRFFILLSMISCSAIAQSKNIEESDPAFVLLDVILYRPVGLAVTIAGTGLFVGLSPIIALASIPAPHDAFYKTSKILILAPAAYTFIRPIGDRNFPHHAPRYNYKPIAAYNNAPIPNHNPAGSSPPQN